MPTRFQERARGVVVAMVTLALLAPPAAVALADLSGIGHRWTDVLAQFSAPAAVGAFAATALLAAFRLRRSAVAGALVSLLCAGAAAPQAFPNRAEPQPGGQTLRLYSANLFVRNDDVAAIRASLRAARPDVVILIETNDAPAAALDDLLADLPHRASSARVNWRGLGARTVIASRWPIGPLREHDGVHAQTVRVRSPLGPVDVTAVHLTRPWPYAVQWEQLRQSEAAAAAVAGRAVPSVVAGDFNSVTDARVGRLFAEKSGLRPAPAFPGSWPSSLPSWLGVGIDNVWISRELAVVERSLGRNNGSDHRPVVTVIGRARS